MANPKVGTLIKEARTNADMTQEQLARRVSGLSASDISFAERGKLVPTQEQLKQIAKATGVKAEKYNLLIAIVIAIIIVLGMNMVGSLLISALIIFPALSAMRMFLNFRSVIICSAVISVFCFCTGLFASYFLETPTGASIVLVDLAVYILFTLLSKRK